MSVSNRIDGVLLIREWPDAAGLATFWCPGCDAGHSITFGGSETWQWDGDAEHPTFSPSVLSFPRKRLIDEGLPMGMGPGELLHPSNTTITPRCHSFVRAGRIEYLTDCEHELAGRTVEMVPLPDRFAAFAD